MPSVKTADFETLRAAISCRLNNFAEICAYYDKGQRFQISNLKSYKGRQKGLEEMGRRLTFGSHKYGRQPKPLHTHMIDPPTRNRSSFATWPSIDNSREDSTQHYIIAFGNGSSPNLCANLPASSKRFLGHLK
jgi:hypothetical protein